MPNPLISLEKQPRHSYVFLWADYVELRCLFSSNGYFSRGALQEIMQEAEDVQVDVLDGEDAEADSAAKADDKISQHWEDITRRLTSRQKSWPSWPFCFEDGVLKSSFQPDLFAHNIYVSLLFASSLRLVSPQKTNQITEEFEKISRYWLKKSLTRCWTVRSFGASSSDYTGSLYHKLEKLAADIHGRLIKEETSYDPRNTGDAGVDLVAWMDMKDRRGYMPVVFGQCACSPTDWEEKQLSVSPSAIEAHIQPQHPAASYCFIPHDLRRSDSEWDRAEHVGRTVLIDRSRFLDLLCHRHFPNGLKSVSETLFPCFPLNLELMGPAPS